LSYAAFEGNREVVGGTIPYMAPEQLLDLQTRGKGEVDARTDLYSLGVMMFELLTGKHPFPVTSRTLSEFEGLIRSRRKGPPPLCELNPAVTPAVEAIVWKLLAPEPANRYQQAVDLREDIDRQLADRPLQFAADRSIPERLGKWRRRNPRVLVAMMLAAVLAAAGGTGAYAFNETDKRAVGQAEGHAREIKDNLDVIRLDLVLPNDPAARTRGMRKAVNLLGEFGLPGDPAWQSKPAFQHLPVTQRGAVEGNLGELLLLVAQARWEDGKTNDRKDAARDAWQLNQLAAGCFGNSPPPFLVRQKAELEAAAAGQPYTAPQLERPTDVRGLFLEATFLMGTGQFGSASKLLEQVVLGAPSHGAAQFCLAFCRQEFAQYSRAVERYEMARAILPRDPRPVYFCGVANGLSERTGGAAAAEESFSQAIEIDPRRGDSYKNRAFARMELGKWDEAEADLTEALKNGASPTQVYSMRSTVRHNRGDEDGAASDRQALAECRPERVADFIALGISHLPVDPKAALAAFRTAEEKNSRSINALRNQAHVLERFLHDDAGALKVMDRIAELYPENGLNRARRAVILARLGQRDAAHREAELAGKLTGDPLVTYLRACTFALTSKTDEQDRKRAMELLKLAFRRGYFEVREYETDPNLDALREMPEFTEVLKAVKRLL
jgi:eukaryotic-like serine/threonine-protein kinase